MKKDENGNIIVTTGDIIDFLSKYPKDTEVCLDHDGWDYYAYDLTEINKVISCVFDDSAITHRGGNYIMINN